MVRKGAAAGGGLTSHDKEPAIEMGTKGSSTDEEVDVMLRGGDSI